jgi:putative endonuclease
MAVHNEVGKMGEDLAAEFFEKRKHKILYRNWRYGNKEIDLVTLYENVIHFVEVKTRSAKRFGFPEGSVTKTKFRNLSRAAEEFLYQNRQYQRIQFDILSINVLPDQQKEYFIIEDVFFN